MSTKLDCAIYAEQYLNILEQIASLYHKNLLRSEVAEFFESYFRYGISIWKWYKKNVENFPDYEIELQLIKGLENIDEVDEEVLEEVQSDRWFYFRWFCDGGNRNV